jgi:hypothetical protein
MNRERPTINTSPLPIGVPLLAVLGMIGRCTEAPLPIDSIVGIRVGPRSPLNDARSVSLARSDRDDHPGPPAAAIGPMIGLDIEKVRAGAGALGVIDRRSDRRAEMMAGRLFVGPLGDTMAP